MHQARCAPPSAAAQSAAPGRSLLPHRCRRRTAAAASSSSPPPPPPPPSRYADPEPVTLYAGSSEHSPDIRVIEIPDSRAYPHQIRGGRILYLDQSSNVHSVYHPPPPATARRSAADAWRARGPPAQRGTGAYFDVLATLPCFLRPAAEAETEDNDDAAPAPAPPDRPIVILGLGAGTVALLMEGAFPGWFSSSPASSPSSPSPSPSGLLVGWELDGAVVDVAREHMGLAPLLDSGALVARVGDALAEPRADELAACSGVIVDLFGGGRLLPELKNPETWRRVVGRRLAPHKGARAIVNLGAGPVPGMPYASPAVADALAALAAMEEALGAKSGGPGVCAAALRSRNTSNLVAMTGPPPGRRALEAAAAMLTASGAAPELVDAAGRTPWQEAGAFSALGAAAAPGGGGGPAAMPGSNGGGRRAHYGGVPGMGMGMGGSGAGRMRF